MPMDIDPLIRELGHDETSGSEALVEQAAKIFVAFSGGFLTDDTEELARGIVDAGQKLLRARPNLAPLFHMVTELYALALEPVGIVMARRAIRSSAVDFTKTYSERAAKVATRGAEQLGTAARVLTVGRSDVVERALLLATEGGSLAGCLIGEDRPAWTGRKLAETLAARVSADWVEHAVRAVGKHPSDGAGKEKALKVARKLAKARPESPVGHFLLGRVLEHEGDDAVAVVIEKLGTAGYYTDQSDSWVMLQIAGPGSRAALERICMLDLHSDAFPVDTVARTTMEHLGVMVLRDGEDSFLLMSARSSARSFLHAVETSIGYTI